MPILAPFEAFARDAVALNVEEDESRLPIRWLAAAQVASRLADARGSERKQLLATWVRQQAADGADGVWSALAVPGIPVRDLPSASAALCKLAEDMERGGALNLAYATVTNMRIAMLERGPAGARGAAALQQARVLRQMGLLEEAQDTYECAQEDAVRAGDKELEGRALLGLAVVAGQRGNYPDVLARGRTALELLPQDSPFRANAHNDLMIAAMVTRDFPSAFEHGWKGYDAADADDEKRAAMINNLSSLALRTGRLKAARRGFLAAFALTKVAHQQLPALGGLALVCATTRNVRELGRVAATIDRVAASTPLRYEVASARFELAQAWKETGNLKKAEECVSSAHDLAVAHGFHEVTFRSELLTEALQASRFAADSSNRDERVEVAIARFEELAVDEAALATA
ncbi:MAG TPA: tetratricopeptide repeat protein [Opitutaceae bacterium]